jgi:DNA-binding transcriptional LysR family regulator
MEWGPGMHSNIERRHFLAAITLAEELSFTRAAKRLDLSQSGLSRQLDDLERRSQLKLFDRNHARVTVTEAGRAFVEEAKLCLVHHERAIQFARAASEGVESHLTIGHSPYIDPMIISTLLAIHLPLHPNLVLYTQSDFAPELVQGVLTSKLDLALIAHPGPNRKLTTTKVTEAPFYIAVHENHPFATKSVLTLNDLRDTPWILFDRKVHPILHAAILRRAAEEMIAVKSNQTVLTAAEAIQLVSENFGIAFLTRTGALGNAKPGVEVRPLIDKELRIEICMASRADNGSKLLSEYARAFMKRISQVLTPPQMTLPMVP